MATTNHTTRPALSHTEHRFLVAYRQLSTQERKLFLRAATCHDEQQRCAYLAQLDPLALDIIIRTLKPQ